jgi:hypothetical protein
VGRGGGVRRIGVRGVGRSREAQGLSAAQYDFHSLSWLQYEYLQQGRFTKARDAMAEVQRALNAPAGPAPPAHPAHVESEIGRGFNPMSLKSELASMKARLVVESGDWAQMKGQGSFDNIDELFALGAASVRLGDKGRADAALEHLGNAATSIPDRDAKEIAQIMRDELDGLMREAAKDKAGSLASVCAGGGARGEASQADRAAVPVKPAAELYGEALLRAGDAAGAVVQFQTSLARTPRRAASLLVWRERRRRRGSRPKPRRRRKRFWPSGTWRIADGRKPRKR